MVLGEVDGVEMGAIQGVQIPLEWVLPDGRGPEDARDRHAITWYDDVHQIIEDEHGHRIGGLSLGDGVRCFLKLDELLVGEDTSIVNDA